MIDMKLCTSLQHNHNADQSPLIQGMAWRHHVIVKTNEAIVHWYIFVAWGWKRVDVRSRVMSQLNNQSIQMLYTLRIGNWTAICSLVLVKVKNISMGYCKKDVTPLLMHWSYIFLVLSHQYVDVLEFESHWTDTNSIQNFSNTAFSNINIPEVLGWFWSSPGTLNSLRPSDAYMRP